MKCQDKWRGGRGAVGAAFGAEKLPRVFCAPLSETRGFRGVACAPLSKMSEIRVSKTCVFRSFHPKERKPSNLRIRSGGLEVGRGGWVLIVIIAIGWLCGLSPHWRSAAFPVNSPPSNPTKMLKGTL